MNLIGFVCLCYAVKEKPKQNETKKKINKSDRAMMNNLNSVGDPE